MIGDSGHEIIDCNLAGNGILHRFNNRAGVPYSAIYVDGIEVFSAPRENEEDMLAYWNKNGVGNILGVKGDNEMNYEEIKLCPFRTYTEIRPAKLVSHGDIMATGFMECLKSDCPAWYQKDEEIPCTGIYQTVEHCKRLEK